LFDLETKHVYDWRNLFMLLSLEKVESYLSEIGFPLASQITALCPIARDFVLALENLEPHIFAIGKPSPETYTLFDETYQKLMDVLGNANAHLLLSWGKDLMLTEKMLTSLDIHHRLFLDLSREPDLPLPFLPQDKRTWLHEATSKYIRDLRERDAAIEASEQLPSDIWEKQAFSIYNFHEEGEFLPSPYDLLHGLMFEMKTRILLKEIQAHLTSDELTSLENWLISHRDWQRSGALPANYIHPYPLIELLERL
jgi:hypothetical protein